MGKTKHLIKHVSRGTNEQPKSDYTVNIIASIRLSDESQEGISSFLDKRKPTWLIEKE